MQFWGCMQPPPPLSFPLWTPPPPGPSFSLYATPPPPKIPDAPLQRDQKEVHGAGLHPLLNYY